MIFLTRFLAALKKARLFDTSRELMASLAGLLATCIASAIGTVVMAFLANKPFVMAPGMGLNSFFAVIAGNVEIGRAHV